MNKNIQIKSTIKPKRIVDEMKESYIDYAMSVIISRALPDIRDGLKPVHRRILYTMLEEGLRYDAKFRKSASVVGGVLAKFHPHGDAAVYDALVRMTQDFSLRYPLIQGQGNFGCFTKDTKVKLADGRNLSFGELIKEQKQGKRHWTFSFNSEAKKIEIAEIKNPRLTRKKEKIMEVILDNREKIKCTLDHQFMLRNGNYKQAKDLKPRDSLMSFYTEHYDSKIDNALNYFTNFSEIVANFQKHNHKVIGTKILQQKQDVYDLTIKPWHNFLLDVGVFVHNSIDGDPPSAMRYSEAKLSKIGEEMLKDIEKDTVDFVDNYDATRKEPIVLPSPLPQLLLNGCSGIAVGMATDILPHNLSELCQAIIYLIEYPKTNTKDLFKFIKGPDFPTGGIIYNQKEVITAYSQGKGPIIARGKAEIVQTKQERAQIIITEIPFRVQKSSLIESFANLVQEKRIEGVKAIRDESDKDGMRIVIELQKNSHPQKILNQLYKFTDLQKTFHLNMLSLVDGIQPKILGLAELLNYFISHRKQVIFRRTKFDLKKSEERAHILQGLAKALLKIDAVIKTIKSSKDREEAKKNLIENFKLSEIQAIAILEMRLSQLAKLERQRIEEELKDKLRIIKELEAILKNPQKIKNIIKKELEDLKERFGDQRKTKIFVQKIDEFAKEDLIAQKRVIISLTRNGYIKRVEPDVYKSQKRGGKGILGLTTLGEDIVEIFLSASTHDSLFLFTDSGKVFKTIVYEIPEGTRIARGRALTNFLEISSQEKVLSMISLDKKDEKSQTKYLIMVTKNGIIKKIELEKFQNIRKTGLIAIRLQKNDSLRAVDKISSQDEVILITKKGKAIRFKGEKIRAMGRTTMGIKGISLKKDDEVIGMDIIAAEKLKNGQILTITENGYGKKTDLKKYRLQSRGGTGIKTNLINKKTGDLILSKSLTIQENLIIISQKGKVVKISIKDIPLLGRATQGVRIMKIEEYDKIAAAICI